jgi:hypothetical protein
MTIYTRILPILCVGLLGTGLASAQEPNAPKQDTDIQLLKKQMLEMQASIQQMQAQHQQEIAALKEQIEDQQKIIADVQKSAVAPPLPAKGGEPPPSVPLFPTTDESLVAATPPPAAPGAAAFPTTDASVTAAPGASPLAGPITIAGGGKTYLNISFDGMFAGAFSTEKHLDRLEVGDHDPQQRGFNARNLELALDGAIDPYFEGFANIVFKLDNENETSVEAEEVFMQTTTLPYGFQLKGGQFFASLGRINSQHPHVWDFADAPLVNGRLLGADGLRGVGVQISWVAPFTWFSQFVLAAQNGNGGTGFSFRNPGEDGVFYNRETINRPLRGVQDLAFIPRWENSFDLSPTQTLVVGVSGAFGPNDTAATTHTQIYSADIFYKWKPANAEGGWPFVKWQTEALYRRYEAGRGVDEAFPVSETFHDWGAYSQVVWGFHKGWNAGVRGDYLHMENSAFTDDPERQSRWRLSADLTWYPSEFSKLRLQYNHDILEANDFLGGSSADSVFLQFEFSLGAHAAHKF